MVSPFWLNWNSKISSSFLVPQPYNSWSVLGSFTCIWVAHTSGQVLMGPTQQLLGIPSLKLTVVVPCSAESKHLNCLISNLCLLNTFGTLYTDWTPAWCPVIRKMSSGKEPGQCGLTSGGVVSFFQRWYSCTDSCLVLKRQLFCIFCPILCLFIMDNVVCRN